MINNKLNIPIYLNQKIIFDMMAIIEDGFSQFVSIETSNEGSTVTNGEVEAGLGLSNKLSFLNVKLDGGISSTDEQNGKVQQTTQKTHTPTSLFQKFWNYLDENKLIKSIESKKDFEVGDFVEFRGTLTKNPIISMVDSFKQIMEMMSVISPSQNGNKKNKNDSEILKQLNALSQGLQTGGKFDLICNVEGNSEIERVVVPVDLEYFGPNGVIEAIEGQYKIIGKVVKYVDNENSINLLRNTSFSRLKSTLLDQLFNAFNSADMDDAGFESTEILTQVSGPSIMILPIAIFI